jgi:hypothetical protein
MLEQDCVIANANTSKRLSDSLLSLLCIRKVCCGSSGHLIEVNMVQLLGGGAEVVRQGAGKWKRLSGCVEDPGWVI